MESQPKTARASAPTENVNTPAPVSAAPPTRIEHVGIAVPDFAGAEVLVAALGIGPLTEPEAVADQKVLVRAVTIGGTRLEFLVPTAEDSPIAKHLAKGGGALHHVALAVPDVAASLAAVAAAGVRLVDTAPRTGHGGSKIAFLHPKSTAGILVELTEPGPDPRE